MQILSEFTHSLQRRFADTQQPIERSKCTKSGHSVFEPAKGHPHQSRCQAYCYNRVLPHKSDSGCPDTEAGYQSIGELVLGDLIPGIEDGSGLLKVVDGDESGNEYGKPEEKAWQRNAEKAT